MKKIQKNKFLVFIFFIIFVNLFILMSLVQNQEIRGCENFIFGFYDDLTPENYLEKFPAALKQEKIFYQIDLFPDIKSLLCLGKNITITSSLEPENDIATSYKLFDFYLFLNIYLIYFIFLIFNRKSTILFTITLLVNSALINLIFFSELTFDYHMLGLILALFIFIKTNINYSKENRKVLYMKFFLILNFHTLLFNYDLFSKLAIFFLIIYLIFFNKKDFDKEVHFLFKSIPVVYFILRLVSGFIREFNQLWLTLSSGIFEGTPRFADMFYVFAILNCKNNKCGTIDNVYGPFFEYIDFYNNSLYSTYIISLFIVAALIFLNIKASKNTIKNNYIIFLLFISPPLTFALERMNLDLFICIATYFALWLFQKNKLIFSFTILSFLSFLKVYPIVFLFSLAFYLLINKDWKRLKITLIFVTFNTGILTHFYLFSNQINDVPMPSGVSWTFGLISHYLSYKDLFSINPGIVFMVFILFAFLIIYIYQDNILNIDLKENLFVTVNLLGFFICSIFFNFDYRICILIVALLFLSKQMLYQNFLYISLIFVLTSASPYLPELTTSMTSIIRFSIPFVYIFLNHVSFYVILIGILISSIKTIISSIKGSDEKI
mgnify:FL=1